MTNAPILYFDIIVTFSTALLFGCLTIGLAFAAQFFGKLILQMALSIFGFVGGPLMGLLSLGIFFPFVNSWVGKQTLHVTTSWPWCVLLWCGIHIAHSSDVTGFKPR